MTELPPVELLLPDAAERIQKFVQRNGDDAATDLATGWIGAGAPATRALGVLVMGRVALHSAQARQLLVSLTVVEDESAEVRRAFAGMLGAQSDCAAAAEILLTLIDDPDEQVRVAAIAGLGITLPEGVSSAHVAVVALLRLLDDPALDVRNWAAFVLGTQLVVDRPEIRDRLLALAETDLDTTDAYPAAEAALGLAVRRDRRVVPIIARRLARDPVTSLWLEASATIADPDLIESLEDLRRREPDDQDDWDDDLTAALAACRAALQQT